jgi:hypothetical protein
MQICILTPIGVPVMLPTIRHLLLLTEIAKKPQTITDLIQSFEAHPPTYSNALSIKFPQYAISRDIAFWMDLGYVIQHPPGLFNRRVLELSDAGHAFLAEFAKNFQGENPPSKEPTEISAHNEIKEESPKKSSLKKSKESTIMKENQDKSTPIDHPTKSPEVIEMGKRLQPFKDEFGKEFCVQNAQKLVPWINEMVATEARGDIASVARAFQTAVFPGQKLTQKQLQSIRTAVAGFLATLD